MWLTQIKDVTTGESLLAPKNLYVSPFVEYHDNTH